MALIVQLIILIIGITLLELGSLLGAIVFGFIICVVYILGWKRIVSIFVYLSIFTVITFFLIPQFGLTTASIISISINIFLMFLKSIFFKINQKRIIRSIIQDDDLNNFRSLINDFNYLIKFSRNTTYLYLQEVNSIDKINIVCERCFNTRDDLLIKLIIKKNWIATEPAQVRIYTILKTNQLNLIHLADDDILNYLLEFLQDQDLEIADNSLQVLVLNNLMNPEKINYLCLQWIKDRDKRLGKIIIKQKYIATYSLEAKMLTALKTKQFELIKNDTEKEVTYLLEFLQDPDSEIANNSIKVLNNLINKEGINCLCKEWIKDRDKRLEKIIIKQKYIATYSLEAKILTALKTEQSELLSNLNLEETIILINAFGDTDTIIANNAKKMGDVLVDPSCKSLIYFLTEQWQKYEQIDFDQQILKNIFYQADFILRKKITEKIKISGNSDWLQVIFAERKRNNIELMTDYDWQVTVELLNKTDNDREKWKLAQQAPPFYSQQLLKQIHSLDFINGKNSFEADLFNLGKTLIPDPSLKTLWIKNNSETITLTGHTNDITSLVMNKEGTLLASSSKDKTIKLWELPSGRLLYTITSNTNSITSLVMNRKGTLLASGSGDKTIKLWTLPSGRLLHTLTGHTSDITSLVMNREGTLLASGSYDKTIKIWELPSGQLLHTRTGHTRYIKSLAMNREGTLLASGSGDKTIKLWKLPSGQLLHNLTGHTDSITSLVMNREGTLLASASGDKTIKLWDLPSGRLLHTLTGHTNWIETLVMNKEGTLLASGSGDKTITLWELPSGRLLHTLTGHTDSVHCLVMNREGTILASGDWNNTIKLWELSSGQLLHTLTGHTNSITSLVMNSEGTLLASASSYDETIKLWKLNSLDRLPLSKVVNYYDYIQDNLKRDDLNENQRNWFEFILALVDNYRRFEIDIEDAPIIAEAGEFDIEIEE